MYDRYVLLSFGIILTLFLTGCSGQPKPDGMPPLHPLTITVTQEGKPLAEASVSLHPIGGEHSWSSGGLTQSDGSLVIYTYGKYAGAPAGKFKVTVDCVTSDPPAPKNVTMEELDAHNKKHPAFRIVPLQYTEKGKTPLEIEVVKGANKITLDIPEKVKLSMGGPP